MAICKCGRRVEVGSSLKQLQVVVRAGIEPGTYKFQVRRPTTRPTHLNNFPLFVANLKNKRQLLEDMFRHSLCHLLFNKNDQNAIYMGSYKYETCKVDHMQS